MTFMLKRAWKSKVLRVMRATVFAIIVSVTQMLAVNSYSQNTPLTLNLKNTTVKDVLGHIQENSEFFFIYDASVIDVQKEISIKAKNKRIPEILDEIFSGLNVVYKIDDRQIALTAMNFPVAEIQQTKTVSGKVTDSSGLPLPGVTVVVKGTTQGTVSNADGEYSLANIPEDATLVFSFVGMKTQEIEVGNQTSINVILVEEIIGIEEVVAIGYGTVRRKDLTTAISTVGAEQIEKITASSFDQALQGAASGLLVTSSQGAPGSQPDIRIRGTNSVSAGGSPLYVIDGLIIPNKSGTANTFDVDKMTPEVTNIFATLNPSDIESVSVLKDAAATAVYGARGSNGVIVITTKRGKPGEAKINFDYYTAAATPYKLFPLTNAAEYITIVNRFTDQVGTPRLFSDQQLEQYERTGGTDWQKAIFRAPAFTHNFNLSADGGTNNVTYFLSGNYYNEQGLVIENNLQRFSVRTNIDASFGKFKMGNSFTASFMLQNDVPYGIERTPEAGPGVISGAMQMPPTDPIYKEDGSFFIFPARSAQAITNPVAIAKTQKIEYKTLRSLGNFYVQYEFIKGLVLRSNLGYDIFSRSDGAYYPKNTTLVGSELGGLARRAGVLSYNWLNENTLSYDNIFGDHSISAVAGATFQEDYTEGLFAGSSSFITDGFESFHLGAGENNLPPASTMAKWQVMSLLSRVSYDYKNKYLITVAGRYDGSSRLGMNDRYDFFPAVSGAWRISEESFFEDMKNTVSALKFRASYGVGGNDQIGNYRSLPTFNTVPVELGNNSFTGVRPGSFGNPDIKWERTTQLDIGVDIGLFNNSIEINADYYSKKTTDLLAPRILATESGFGSITVNAGELENHGLEMDIGGRVNIGQLKWNINANGSIEKNKFISLGEFTQADTVRTGSGYTARIVGQPLGTWFIPRFLGIYQEGQEAEAAIYSKEPGDPIIEDKNNDGRILPFDDYSTMGLVEPNKYFGLQSNMYYKNFDFSFYFQGAFGHRIYNYDYVNRGYQIVSGFSNFYTSLLDAWTPENKSNTTPRLGARINELYNSSTVQKADYVRLQNVTFGYNFNDRILNKLNVSKLRVYVSGQNLFTFTKYEGINPEGGARSGYPISKSYRIGVNLSF